MVEVTGQLGPKLSQVIKENSLREISSKKVGELKALDPRGVNRKYALIEAIQQKKITFQDSLQVIRETNMMEYPDPKDDKPTSDVMNHLNLFIWNDGNAVYQTYSQEAEMQYIINDGVLSPVLRLPQVIEGVRQMILGIERDGYPEKTGGKQRKTEKVERLSNYLYALSEFQTDLTTDELIKITGKNWKETRKRVVKWGKNVNKELEGYAKNNPRLRSLLEKPVYMHKDEGTFSPLELMFKNPGVKKQSLPNK